MYSASDFEALVRDYLNSPQGQKDMQKRGISVSGYTQDEMLAIATELKNALISEFMSITTHADLQAANEYFGGRYVTAKILKNGNGRVTFSQHSLYRPSLMGLKGKSTGSGINDIFALITNGKDATGKVFGDWMYYNRETKEYGDGGEIVRGRLPRVAKPFVAKVIQNFESKYKGLKITYPEDWK